MSKKVITIGGGLAGLAGAIRLAKLGFDVQLFEQNETLGGKMNEIHLGDYRFDTGPSLLTMPFVIDELFEFLELERKSYLEFVFIDPICRYFYSDGNILDASSEFEKMQSEIEDLYKQSGLKITHRYSPGYCGWPVSDQQKLFSFFPQHFAGITLSDSSVMSPFAWPSPIRSLISSARSEPFCK